MKQAAILLAAAMLCEAAQVDDHAILQRAFAGGHEAESERDLYRGKAAVYRPVRLAFMITGVAGQGCESRFGGGAGAHVVDWAEVRRIETSVERTRARVWIVSGRDDDVSRLVISFRSAEEATPAVRAMERLQAACAPRPGR